MDLLAHARIAMWDGGSLWIVDAVAPPGRRTAPHAHHAIQISFSLGGWQRLHAGDRVVEGRVIAIAADSTHLLEGRGAIGQLFVDPDSRSGRTIARALLGDGPLVELPAHLLHPFAAPLLAAFHASPREDAPLIALGRAMVERLAGGAAGDAPDLRVRKLMTAAAARLDEPISLGDFAGIGGLSAERLRHLFVEQTGLAFRTYVLWLRLSRAVAAMAAGVPLTAAAHAAGFADSAHFSRTFRRMFGIAPSALRIA